VVSLKKISKPLGLDEARLIQLIYMNHNQLMQIADKIYEKFKDADWETKAKLIIAIDSAYNAFKWYLIKKLFYPELSDLNLSNINPQDGGGSSG
jgi:hypothetical protein